MNNKTKTCAFCRTIIKGKTFILEQRDFKFWRNLDEKKVGRYCCPDCYYKKVAHMRALQGIKDNLRKEIDNDG